MLAAQYYCFSWTNLHENKRIKFFIYSVSLSVFCFQAWVCNLCRLYLMLTTPPLRPSNKLILYFIFFPAPYKTTGPCTSHVTPNILDIAYRYDWLQLKNGKNKQYLLGCFFTSLLVFSWVLFHSSQSCCEDIPVRREHFSPVLLLFHSSQSCFCLICFSSFIFRFK